MMSERFFIVMRWLWLVIIPIASSHTAAAGTFIPATPVMALYQFNGPEQLPYYAVTAHGIGAQAGTLAQGSAVIPCLIVRHGQALMDDDGALYVGFQLVFNATHATPATAAALEQTLTQRRALQVPNHHCPADVQHVMRIRHLATLERVPLFNMSGQGDMALAIQSATGTLDAIVRAFHNSPQCSAVNQQLTGRRGALSRAWETFIDSHAGQWEQTALIRAKHLDYSMRTTLYEGHLGRGCNAYGACERNIILLSIRNRAVGQCNQQQGCRFPGDFQGVSSAPAQYNIWDEYLTQVSGLTTCYLRTDLADHSTTRRVQAMYQQTVGDAERILYGTTTDLMTLFPDTALADVTGLRHYYHPPAMGKCFPQEPQLHYITGAVAKRAGQFALITNTRIAVGAATHGGYYFREARITTDGAGVDQIQLRDRYPAFIIEQRAITPGSSRRRCTAYGVAAQCQFTTIGRYRTTPNWLTTGKPLAMQCRVQAQDKACAAPAQIRTVTVGGSCDVDMMPVTRVP